MGGDKGFSGKTFGVEKRVWVKFFLTDLQANYAASG